MLSLQSTQELIIEDLSLDSKISILTFDICQDNNFTNLNCEGVQGVEIAEELLHLEGIFQYDRWKTFLDHSIAMQTNPCKVLINNNRNNMIHYALFYESYNILKMVLWNAKNFEKTDFKHNCTLEWTQLLAFEFFTYPPQIIQRFFQSLLYRLGDLEILEWIFYSAYEFGKKVEKTKELTEFWDEILKYEDLRSLTIIFSEDDVVTLNYPFWFK